MVQLQVWVPGLIVYRAEFKGELKGSFPWGFKNHYYSLRISIEILLLLLLSRPHSPLLGLRRYFSSFILYMVGRARGSVVIKALC
jgi:hypothetical protein